MEKNISPIKQRILIYAENKGYSKRKVYQDTGIANGVLDKITGLSEDNIEKFISTYTDINPEWFLTGVGNMLRSDLEVIRTSSEHELNVGIPLIPLSAMAGAFTCDTQVLQHECERYVVPSFKGADFLISVKGSSMYPRYNSGDIVACKRLALDTFFQWNKVYVLDTDQGPLIKRIKKGSKPDTLLIVSDNERYDPFELHRSHIYNVALVIGVIRME